MDLETLLPAIRSLHDLPGLVAALGHQPLWEELPAESKRGSSSGLPALTIVGRTKDLPWFAIQGLDAISSAESWRSV